MVDLLRRRRRAPNVRPDVDPATVARITEAGRRLAAWRAGSTPPLSLLRARRARRRRQRRLVATTAAALVLAGATGAALLSQPGSQRVSTSATPGASSSTSPGTGRPSRRATSGGREPSVRVALHLDRTVVPADGTPIVGEAVVTNTTRATITVETCQPPPSRSDAWLFVGLANATISYNPAVATPACAPSIKLHPGANDFPITVMTTFQSCTQSPARATRQHPACTRLGPPSLPPGTYTTRVLTYGLPAGWQHPAPLRVTLRPTGDASPAVRSLTR